MIYPDKLPYLKTVKKACYLPKGQPAGKGNLVFLLSNSRNESYDMSNNQLNLKGGSFYKYFYYNLNYRGKIAGKPYIVKELQHRKDI